MKKIGLVGGIGPASTIEYYRELIRLYQSEIQQDRYPEIVIDSVNMTKHNQVIAQKNYDLLAEYIIESIENLKAAGAEMAAVTANTEHIVWNKICNRLPLPTVNVLDVVTEEIEKQQYKKILILGTEWTMESKLFETVILKAGGCPITPNDEDQKEIGKLIYPNLENGIVILEDKKRMLSIIEKYYKHFGIDAVLLGCTELPIMIQASDLKVSVINTTRLHIRKILAQSLL